MDIIYLLFGLMLLLMLLILCMINMMINRADKFITICVMIFAIVACYLMYASGRKTATKQVQMNQIVPLAIP